MSKKMCAVGLVLVFLGTSASSFRASQAASVQSPYSKRARLEPKFSGPVTLDLTGDTQQGFEKLAALAGIQVVFHPQFAPAAFPPDWTLNAVDFFDALDRLSRLSGSFWETYDRKTILVAPDDSATRKQVEMQALKTVGFPAAAVGTPIAASQLKALSARMEWKTAAVSTPQNAILLRESVENVAMAEEILAAAAGTADSGTLLVDMAGNIHAPEAGLLRKTIAGSHRELQAVTPGPLTLRMQNPSREMFQMLADRAGIQVIFHRQFANLVAKPFALDDVDIFTALDLLSFTTGNFWQVVDPHTIVVATNNPTVRRDVEPMVLKPIFLKNILRPQEVTELVTALRALLGFNQIAMSTPQNALLLRDTADKVALAETIAAVFDRPAPGSPAASGQTVAAAGIPSGVFAQPSDEDTRRAMVSQLQLPSAAPLSITMNVPSRQAFETLASRAGVQIVFHRQFANQAAFQFAVKDADLATALDRLSFVTGNFWQVLDSHTIVVATNNPTVRRDVEPMVLKPIFLKNIIKQQEVTELVTALRTLLSFNQIVMSTPQNMILLRDTADKVALAEKIAAVFDRPAPGAPAASGQTVAATGIPSGVFAQPTDEDARRAMVSQLQLPSAAPLSITMNVPSRQAFETLASQSGMQIVFHRQFANAAAFQFAVKDADFATALDRLSFVTGNFWQVLDPHTIVVATNNPTVRRDVEPMVLKPIFLKNLTKQQEVTELVTALHDLLGFNQIAMSIPQNAIMLRDTADKVALAEKIAAVFDRPAPGATAASGQTVAAPGIPSGVFAQPSDEDTRRAMVSQLQLPSAAPLSITMNVPSRQAFETLAARAGVQIVFHRQFANQAAFQFAVKDADLATALDRLSFVTGNFWKVLDFHTIVVATDNPTVRRDVEPMVLKPIFLKNLTEQQEVTELVTALRTLLSFNQIAMSTPQNIILLRDTADKVGLAEKIAAVFDRPTPGRAAASSPAAVVPGIPSGVFAQPTDTDAMRIARSTLQLQTTGPVSIRMNQPSRNAFETLAQLAGIQVDFHRQFVNTAAFAFAQEGADALTTLDRLAFMTGNFWQVQDAHTIIVATDNPTVRRSVEPMIVKTMYLRNVTTEREATEIVIALRTILSFNQVGVSNSTGAIVLRDTAEKIALAQKMVDLFDPPGGDSVAVPVAAPFSSGVFSTPVDAAARRARLRSELHLDSVGLVSAAFTHTSRQAFETLAGISGFRVIFHPSFTDAAAFAFQVENVDLVEALDRLSFRTGNFWQLSSEKTLLVAPDNTTVRKEVESAVTKTIGLKNIQTAAGVTEVAAALRSLAAITQIENNENSVTLTDTMDKIALAERIVAELDIPGRTPLARTR